MTHARYQSLSASNRPKPTADFTEPALAPPASVIPKCRADQSVLQEVGKIQPLEIHLEVFTLT